MKELMKTRSLCPICHIPLDAIYVEENGQVFMRKTCPQHGEFESYVANQVEDYIAWTGHKVVNIPPKKAITQGAANKSFAGGNSDSECPLHCGTCENHIQTACCVLIDVTERCNQHCPYCFAKAEDDCLADPDLLGIERKYDLLLELGEERPFNIQLSGGEPTVREDLPDIIKMGRDKGFEYIQINTNGRRLAMEDGYAKLLKRSGASVVYLQFDGTNDDIYQALRGEPLFDVKKRAIANCRKAGLAVVLVPTIVKNVNLDNIGSMMSFLLENISVVKGIHFQPVSFFGRHPDKLSPDGGKRVDYENRVTMFDVMHELEKQTDGKFKYDDLCPITSGHTLCCFYGTYRKQKDNRVKSLISDQTKEKGVCCCDAATPLDIIKKDRDYVLNKWDLPEQDDDCCCDGEASAHHQGQACCEEPQVMDFDQFLAELKGSMFTVSAMAFQDVSNLDAERLKRCRVQVLSPDDRLIPFCAYNSLYRK